MVQPRSREDWLRLAADMVPTLKDRADRAQELRQIPPETVRDFAGAGFFRLFTPERFGGGGHELDLSMDIAMELGRGCGSTAWCYAVWMAHNWMVGHWPLQAQEEYFGAGPDTLSSSGFAPTGKLDPVASGFTLSGRWDFSSGCDAATWAILDAIGPMGPAFALVPRADYQIVDTWFVSGLRGTGSKDIEVREAFVPAHRVALLSDLNRGVSPGWDLHARPSYRLPVMLGLSGTIASPLVGIAQGGVDEVVARARNPKTGSRTAQSVPMQLRLAESAAEVDSARLILRHQAAGLLERAARGDLPDLLEQACYRRGFAYAARLSVHAVSRLFEGSGGHALYDSQAIQRHFRDVHAGSHHFVVSWDPQAEQYARAAFGLPTEGPTFARGNAPS